MLEMCFELEYHSHPQFIETTKIPGGNSFAGMCIPPAFVDAT
jgi:hypothetical protein